MTFQIVLGASISVMAIVALSIFSGKKAKEIKGANSFMVAGAIMGTLVGGSSTIGTAQLAYQYGMSAWWYTLGGGIACLILALIYAKPFHRSGNKTLNAFVTKEYGIKNGFISSVFCSVGSFINVISQLISATAIIAVIFPNVPLFASLFFSAIIMVLYIIFGGVKGSGIVGILKTILIYIAMIATGLLVLHFSGGWSGFVNNIRSIDNPENIQFHSLFARGVSKDLGACVSLIIGVISTQSYAQAVIMAGKEKQAMKGALLSSVLMPIVGIGGILVGLFMRSVHPDIIPKAALTYFVTQYMPPMLGGVVLGTLFVTVIGSGAGISLGVAIIITKDILPLFKGKLISKLRDDIVEKATLVLILTLACFLSMGPLGDTILNFAFMSMGLRGATLFIPLCFALLYPGRVRPKYATFSIIVGPTMTLVFNLFDILPFDPLVAGIIASYFIMLAGLLENRLSKKVI